MPDWRKPSTWLGTTALAAIGLAIAGFLRRIWSRGIGRRRARGDEPIDEALEQRLERLIRHSTWLDRPEPDPSGPQEQPRSSVQGPEPPAYNEDVLLHMHWKWTWQRNSLQEWEVAELKPFCARPDCNRELVAVSSHSRPEGPRTVFLCASQDFSHAVPVEGTERELRLRVRQIIEQKSRGDAEPTERT